MCVLEIMWTHSVCVLANPISRIDKNLCFLEDFPKKYKNILPKRNVTLASHKNYPKISGAKQTTCQAKLRAPVMVLIIIYFNGPPETKRACNLCLLIKEIKFPPKIFPYTPKKKSEKL